MNRRNIDFDLHAIRILKEKLTQTVARHDIQSERDSVSFQASANLIVIRSVKRNVIHGAGTPCRSRHRDTEFSLLYALGSLQPLMVLVNTMTCTPILNPLSFSC